MRRTGDTPHQPQRPRGVLNSHGRNTARAMRGTSVCRTPGSARNRSPVRTRIASPATHAAPTPPALHPPRPPRGALWLLARGTARQASTVTYTAYVCWRGVRGSSSRHLVGGRCFPVSARRNAGSEHKEEIEEINSTAAGHQRVSTVYVKAVSQIRQHKQYDRNGECVYRGTGRQGSHHAPVPWSQKKAVAVCRPVLYIRRNAGDGRSCTICRARFRNARAAARGAFVRAC